MKKICLHFMLLFFIVSVACSAPGRMIRQIQVSPPTADQTTPPAGLIPPQTDFATLTIGGTTIEQGRDVALYKNFWQYCIYIPEEAAPASYTVNCAIPQMDIITVPFGWMATPEKFDASWQAIHFELVFDGQPVPLENFTWVEDTHSEGQVAYMERAWYLNFKNLPVGQHTLVIAWTTSEAINDGFTTYQPGRYEHVLNFSVSEKKSYPQAGGKIQPGQHGFSSKNSLLNYLLYLPQDYDPTSRHWPLIIYLHNASLAGTTLDILQEATLPAELDLKGNFPALVVSPLEDFYDEAWSDYAMMPRVISLVDEITQLYAVDTDKIYLVGDGMGANGAWELALEYPDRFAALLPVGGYVGYPFTVPENICTIKNTAVWAFHGKKDVDIPATAEEGLINALKACGGQANITIEDETTTDMAEEVYRNARVYEWLLQQSRK